MCGICGIFDNRSTYSEQDLINMNETMYNRGPDGYGIHFENGYGLAMRRLSIIDLENGWQPIYSEDKSVIVVLNGEIYNYKILKKELKDKGHIFKTNSDTEIIVHGYEQWGLEGLLKRIDGMFGFCVWDKKEDVIFIARDRFGEKPVYYYNDNYRIIFASQLMTVAKMLNEKPEISEAAAYLYLGLHYIPGDITIFKNIHKLLPGQYLKVSLKDIGIQKIRYWQLSEGKKTRPITTEEMIEMLRQSVKSRMVADVPVGVFLSGGIDSSIVAALAKEQNPKLQTFSIGFKNTGVDESYYSKLAASYIQSEHNHFEFDLNNFTSLIPKIIPIMDEPVGDQAMLPVFLLSSEAVKHVKVVMGGDGADELFGGYGYYLNKAYKPDFKYKLKRIFAKLGNRTVIDNSLFLSINETPSGFPILTTEKERLKLLDLEASPILGEWADNLQHKLDSTSDFLSRVSVCDIETWLPEDLLMKFDKMAMANSLEGRSPYLHPDIARIAMSLPLEQRIKNNSGKQILKQVAKEILPVDIAERKKQGFILPMRKWLANELREELLESIRECPDNTVDLRGLEQIVNDDIKNGLNRERLLYAILIYVKWIRYAFEYLKKRD